MRDVVGVAGCGAMGLPMARRLPGAGFEVWGFDVRPVSEFGDFAPRMIADPDAFAARCDTVVSVVRDAAQTFDLCFDAQKVFAGPAAPQRLVVASTLSPRALPAIAERLAAGTVTIDAPMSGAPHSAEAGTLTFLLGGTDDEIAALMPLFEAMGGTIHHLGPAGAGMTCKVLNDFAAATSVLAVRRVLGAARELGVDGDRLRAVMRTSSGGTWYGDNLERIAWAREGYHPANTIGILEKDVAAYLDAADGLEGAFEAAVVDGLRALEPLE